jgi:HEAT repeat protein
VRGAALQQLIQAGAPEGLSLAEAALTGKDPEVARNVVWALANGGGADGHRLLARALGSDSAPVRAAAAQALANSGDEASTAQLVGLVRDPDSQVRTAALSALGQVGSGKAVDAVLSATGAGKPEDRSAAVYALAQLDDPRAETAMARLMRDPDEAVAQAAIGASYNGGAEVDRALIGLVGDGGASASLRAQAAQQLRSRGAAIDDATRKQVEALVGPETADGGARFVEIE